MVASEVRADALGREQIPPYKRASELAVHVSVNKQICIENPHLTYLHVQTSANGFFSTVF
jgi:hypothetical protein